MGEKRVMKYFGTDGFRGEFGKELTLKHAYAIGKFLGLGGCKNRGDDDKKNEGERVTRILVGRDTRESSPLLAAAVIAGVYAGGGETFDAGVITTPGLSYLTKIGGPDGGGARISQVNKARGEDADSNAKDSRKSEEDFEARGEGFDGGVMITASHNPYCDNGIKIFDFSGQKVADEVIFELEDYIDLALYEGIKAENYSLERKDYPDSKEDYIKMLTEGKVGTLERLRIGLDTASGAAFEIAPEVFKRLGAEVFQLDDMPDGRNINDGVGSTHPEALATFVVENGLDFGFAFDGDGDRCITIAGDGKIIDGDGEMFILARAMRARGELIGDTVVATVMSGGGLIKSLEKTGIGCEICPVGDRFVFEKMQEFDCALGGEQSGHIIIGKRPTGDGIFTAVCLALAARESGVRMGELVRELVVFPQMSESVRVGDKGAIMRDEGLLRLYDEVGREIGDDGRILLRPSGTENVIRVMVEHKNEERCKLYLSKLTNFIQSVAVAYDG